MKPNLAFFAILALGGFLGYRMFGGAKPETDGPKYSHGAESGFSTAMGSQKPIVLIFSAAWCGPCQDMKKRVYPSKTVEPYHDQFVWIYADVDLPENQALAKKYNVSSIPHIQFLSPKQDDMGFIIGGTSADTFAEKLQEVKSRLP